MKIFKIYFYNLFFLLLFLLIFDNLLFFASPLLPKDIVKILSSKSQTRYRIKNKDNSDLKTIFKEHIYYLRPNSKQNIISDGLPSFEYADEHGYVNPKNYLKSGEVDLLLVGDSATQAQSFSNEMRKNFEGKVYSIGIGGQGPYHWKYQYKRISKIVPDFEEPKNILLLYDENDIDDTQRALKYFRKGYTHSAYYPPNPYNDNFKKYNMNFSFYSEVYSIFRYFVVSTQIRVKLKHFIEDRVNLNVKSKMEKLKIIPKEDQNDGQTYKLINYDNTCIIRANVLHGDRVFDQNKTRDTANEINKILQLINFEKTNVFFSYNPSVNTIYNLKLDKNEYVMQMSNEQKLSSKNFSTFFKEKNVHYIDLTDDIRKIAATKPLHPCNGSDSHLSVDGYKLYSKLLTKKIKSILKDK